MHNKIKQISYLSAIIFVIGSTIGAGIFFKNAELLKMAQGDLFFVVAAWLVAAFGMMALGLALVEISSAQKSNKGILEWTKVFMPKFLHKTSQNYIKLIFIPVSLFTLPLYVVSTFEDVGLEIRNAWVVLAFGFFIFLWFISSSLLSIQFTEKQQWILTVIKFIPLIILPIIALTISSFTGTNTFLQKNIHPTTGLVGISKWIIVIAGIPAISFAYDGFYLVFSLRNKTSTKTRKHLGSGVVVGLLVITIVYLFLSIAFNYGSDSGTHSGLNFAYKKQWIQFFDFCIALGIMGIINGFTASSPYQLSSLIEEGESADLVWLRKKIFANSNNKLEEQNFLVSWIYIVVSTTIFFVVFGIIGVFYPNDSWDGFETYGSGTYLYSFVDILVNYTSLLIFLILSGILVGGLINRFTKKVVVEQKKYFLPMAFFSAVLFIASFCFTIFASILEMSNFNGASAEEASIKFVIFVLILFVSMLPSLLNLIRTKFLIKSSKAL